MVFPSVENVETAGAQESVGLTVVKSTYAKVDFPGEVGCTHFQFYVYICSSRDD